VCVHVACKGKLILTKFWSENLTERDHLDRREDNFRYDLEKYVWTGFIWFRTGTSGGLRTGSCGGL
jgi:hypothetical protein